MIVPLLVYITDTSLIFTPQLLTWYGKMKVMDPEQEDRIMVELGTLTEKLDEIIRLLQPKPVGRPRKQPGSPIPGVQRAVEFLQSLEEDFGAEISAIDLWAEANAQGISRPYLFQAKNELGIAAFRRGRQWYWHLREPQVERWVTHPTKGISVPFDSLTDEEKSQVEGKADDGVSAEPKGVAHRGQEGTLPGEKPEESVEPRHVVPSPTTEPETAGASVDSVGRVAVETTGPKTALPPPVIPKGDGWVPGQVDLLGEKP